MVRILIVGQGPSSKHEEGKKALEGVGSGDRLAKMAGITRGEMLERATTVNLLNKFYGKNGKGDQFPMEEAKKSADALRVACDNYDNVVLLGDNVAKAFGFVGEHLRWYGINGNTVAAIVPHPSGVNLWYNDPENKYAAETFLTNLFRPEKSEEKSDKKTRAEHCTAYLEKFDKQNDWVELARIVREVKDSQLFLEVGSETFDEWLRKHAPRSYRLCYMRSAQYKALTPYFSDEELKKIPPETASWASKAKNISPAELSKPEVKEALLLPKQKAVEFLREALPDQHIEHECRVVCKFAVSQEKVVRQGYDVFKRHKDESASLEDFIEFVVSEWILSFGGV